VVHNIPTTGYAKWYLGSSLLAAIITCIPGAAAHAWGYDPFFETCWLVSTDATERVAWLIGTTYTWTLLSAAVSFGSAAVVLLSLVMSTRRTRDAFSAAGMHSHAFAQRSVSQRMALRIMPHPLFLGEMPMPAYSSALTQFSHQSLATSLWLPLICLPPFTRMHT
jgi:hypothetical protein